MKKMALTMVCCMLWTTCLAIAAVRVDVREFAIATGVESLGTVNGSGVSQWDTTKEPDGWKTLTSGGMSANVLVLNGPLVAGGRMTANTTWNSSRVVVVRDDVVVPTGKTLTLGAGCVVKFTEGARFVVESGGKLVSNGAYLAAFDDDSVGGDTDMNGAAASTTSSDPWWLDDAATAALATVRFIDGATNLPTRSYSAGKSFGTLPQLTRNGAMFDGWYTARDGGGMPVTAQDAVAGGETALYANWIPFSIEISPSSQAFNSGAATGSFTVNANEAWQATCSASWVTVNRSENAVAFTLAANNSTQPRMATIRVTATSGGSLDFTLTQSGMEVVTAPSIAPADGTEFDGPSRRVSISGGSDGAEIRYTLDGSEPTESSKLYTKSFNVFDTTTVKAKAFKSGMLASATVTARIVRLQTLAEALDVPMWTVTSAGAGPWVVTQDVSHDGASSARSGAIGNEQSSSMAAIIEGAGTLTFWWKADCEDDEDTDNWDYLKFEVDGREIARIDGHTGWQQVSARVNGEGVHTLTWTYVKDYTDDGGSAGQDCGWVDQISWMAFAGNSGVPVAWLENLGVVSAGVSAADAAESDPDGDGLTTAEEYVAGTDPGDPESVFLAFVEIHDGRPVISWTPNLLDERKYTLYGRSSLSDEEWHPITEGHEGEYMLFRVGVEMPDTDPSSTNRIVYTVNLAGWPRMVTFDADGGEGGWSKPLGYGTEIVAPTVRRWGYRFIGWAPEVADIVLDEDLTYVAQWEDASCEIVFDYGFGDPEKLPATEDWTIGELPAPVRNGYALLGWFTEKSGGEKVTAETVVTGDMTLYARWAAAWTVTLNVNGGRLDGGNKVLAAKGKAVGTLPTPTRAGYAFKGWYTKKSGGAKITTKTKVTKNVTYYAQWTVKKYVVKVVKEGKGTVTGAGSKAYKSKVTLKAKAASGYVFQGWYLDDVLKSRKATYSFTVPLGGVTYKAVFLTKAQDKAGIGMVFDGVGVGAVGGGQGQAALPVQTNVCGVAITAVPIAATGLTPTSVTVTGLPTGLKYDAKKKAIIGTPTAIKTFTAKITVKSAGASRSWTVKWVIVPVPAWARGTFKGTLFSEAGTPMGSFTLTVGKTGKVSGKFVNLKKVQYPFAVGSFKSFTDDILKTKASMKYGKKTLPVEIAVGYEAIEGGDGETVVTGSAEVIVRSGTATFGIAVLAR